MEFMAEQPDKSFDLTVTSPPYDEIRDYNGTMVWDEKKWMDIIEQLFRITKPGGVVVWVVADQTKNGSESCTSFKQAIHFVECGFNLHDTMIWEKISAFQHQKRYIPSFEYMFVFSKGEIKTANIIKDRKNIYSGMKIHGTRRGVDGQPKKITKKQRANTVKDFGSRFNIWKTMPDKSPSLHPAKFPLQLAADHIKTWSNKGDTIFDPFLGSGTTAIAAHYYGCKFVGCEIDKDYYTAAVERFKKETRQEAFDF